MIVDVGGSMDNANLVSSPSSSLDHLPLMPSEDVVAMIGGYRTERILGQGGAGVVYLARDEELDRRVAIKVLHPHNARDPVRRKRFLREGRVMALIDSPHITQVLHVGEDHGAPYLVMEYLEGEDLAARVKRDGPLPVNEALGYVRDTARALESADAAGITHRDVKPANLIVTAGHVRLTDFGLAVAVDETSSLTVDGLVAGTAAYMAPERLQGKSDRRSDIYSLGATLFTLLTARTPFEAGDPLAHLSAHLRLSPPRVDSLRDDVPPKVADLVGRMLAKDPADRMQTYAELIGAIDRLRGDDEDASMEGPDGVRGSLNRMSVLEIVQTLELGSRDARVDLRLPGERSALIGVIGGHVVYASSGVLKGVDAFCAIAAESEGSFTIRYQSIDDLGRNVDLPTSGLLLESVRRLDEANAGKVAVEPSMPDLPAAPPPSESGFFDLPEEATPADARPLRERARVSALRAWLLIALFLALGSAVGLALEEPMLGTHAERTRVRNVERAETTSRARATRLAAQLAIEQRKAAALSRESEELRAEHERLAAEREAAATAAASLEAKVRKERMNVRRLANGVVVELPSRVLFSTGADQLNARGRSTVERVAKILATTEGHRFRVEGHTDNVPTGRDSSHRSNWELSAARALTVRRHLEQSGVDPAKLSAEARGEYAPVRSNDTRRGREANRRIEIYVVPDSSPRDAWRVAPDKVSAAKSK
jgi:flagellar motor protein MotB/tRNA A-37 threonylcarbamoyl transferase component Bud32